jgi:hypothetical protein
MPGTIATNRKMFTDGFLVPIDSFIDRAAEEFPLRLKAIATEELAHPELSGDGMTPQRFRLPRQ